MLNTSESEGLSNALVEAMRCGAVRCGLRIDVRRLTTLIQQLCVARRCAGNASTITHLSTGVLFDTAEVVRAPASSGAD